MKRAIWTAGIVALACTGCVERLLQIRSEPPGATVFVNGEKAGRTPLDYAFTFYGTFDVTVRAPHYHSVRRLEDVFPPWYEHFPLDFLSENFIPWTVRDHRLIEIKLAEAPRGSAEVDRAKVDAVKGMNELEGRLEPGEPRTP